MKTQQIRACAVTAAALLLLLVAAPASADSAELAAAQSVGAVADDDAEAAEEEPHSEELLAQRDDLKEQLVTKTKEFLKQHKRADMLARQVHALKKALQGEQRKEKAQAAKLQHVNAVLAKLSSEASAAEALTDDDSTKRVRKATSHAGSPSEHAKKKGGTHLVAVSSQSTQTDHPAHHSEVQKHRLRRAAPAATSHVPHRNSSGAAEAKQSQEGGGKQAAASSGTSNAKALTDEHSSTQAKATNLGSAHGVRRPHEAEGTSHTGRPSRDAKKKVSTRSVAVSSQSPQAVNHHRQHPEVPKHNLRLAALAATSDAPHRTSSGAAAATRSQEGGGKLAAAPNAFHAEAAAPKKLVAAPPQPQISLLAVDSSANSDDLGAPAELKFPEVAAALSAESQAAAPKQLGAAPPQPQMSLLAVDSSANGDDLGAPAELKFPEGAAALSAESQGAGLGDPLNVGAAAFGDGEGAVSGAEAATSTDLADLEAQLQQEGALTGP